MRKVSPFIMSGGSGTRLWPVSCEAYPKQFHRFLGAESLFQQTCRSFSDSLFSALRRNRVYRPWGWYQTLKRGERYQVKCIMVKPGCKLSLQSHYHRSEHWIVVKGTLEVTKDEKAEPLTENQSTYIPIG